VHQLQDNLNKYESVIASLKELKEMEQIEKQQEEFNKNGPSREVKLKRYIETLEKEIFESRREIKKLNNEQAELLSRLAVL
jgi:flagellar biosynthesis chaperone FliJ